MDGGDLHRENWHRCNRTCHSLRRGSHAGHWLWREGEREGVCVCVCVCTRACFTWQVFLESVLLPVSLSHCGVKSKKRGTIQPLRGRESRSHADTHAQTRAHTHTHTHTRH